MPIKSRVAIHNPDWYISSKKDPVKEMLEFYDGIIGEYLRAVDIEFIVATGLSQKPYDRIKYYYRLKDHKGFLQRVGIACSAVHPRMTRDFLVEFADAAEMDKAIARFRSLRVEHDGVHLFEEIEVRDKSMFVTLTYPHEITSTTNVLVDNLRIPLLPEVAFVALKNGMHQSEGYAFFSAGAAGNAPVDRQHVKALYEAIQSYFIEIPAIGASSSRE